MGAKNCYPLHGLPPIINTPFDDRLEIDFASLERLLAQGIRDGIVGCIVPAVASEVDKLSPTERKKLIESVAALARKRIQVITGVQLGTPRAEPGTGAARDPGRLHRHPLPCAVIVTGR
jgi:dihydrodipicolinate synthase/N-acetylneuraminate lyase